MVDIRVTTYGDTRVTSYGAIRITSDQNAEGTASTTLFGFTQSAIGHVANKKKPAYHGFVGGFTEQELHDARARVAAASRIAAQQISEQEFFRAGAAARGVDGMVPPSIIAHRNLTTTQHPRIRPVVVPTSQAKPK